MYEVAGPSACLPYPCAVIFELQYGIATIISLGMLLVVAFAFVDAISRPAQAFVAADKMTKQGWMIILGLALLVQLLLAGVFLTLIGLVAGLVYILDARPALRAVTRR
jgi:Protein of unknown function (DUF2516)